MIKDMQDHPAFDVLLAVLDALFPRCSEQMLNMASRAASATEGETATFRIALEAVEPMVSDPQTALARISRPGARMTFILADAGVQEPPTSAALIATFPGGFVDLRYTARPQSSGSQSARADSLRITLGGAAAMQEAAEHAAALYRANLGAKLGRLIGRDTDPVFVAAFIDAALGAIAARPVDVDVAQAIRERLSDAGLAAMLAAPPLRPEFAAQRAA